MSGLIIPTEREDVFLREVTEVEDVAWFLATRMFTHPANPDQPDAPDYVAFKWLRQARVRDPDALEEIIETGIWHRDVLTGYMNLDRPTRQAEIARVGYRLAPQYEGNGYATTALRAMSTYAFEELGIRKIEARIKPRNRKSQDVARRAGFELLSSHAGTLIFTLAAPERQEDEKTGS